jgi:hypothetical protein
LSIEQANGTGAASAKLAASTSDTAGFAAAGAADNPLAPPADTAFNAPVLMVDFSVVVAAKARR